jgi:hypothetical protein
MNLVRRECLHSATKLRFHINNVGKKTPWRFALVSSRSNFSREILQAQRERSESLDVELDLHSHRPALLAVLTRNRINPWRDNLNVRHLAELAGLLSVHALQIVECPPRGIGEPFARLARTCRERAEAWTFRIESLAKKSKPWSALYPAGHDPSSPVIEEVLTSEILTRVLAGILTAQGQHHGEKAACLFAATLFLEHQEARRLALTRMLKMADAQNPSVRKLDKLRRSAERWTDVLLGPLACRFLIGDLPFDMARAQDYGRALLPNLTSPTGGGLYAAGLKSAFPESIVGVPSHAGFHRDMAAAVFGILPSQLFERDGGLLPLRTFRSHQSHVKSRSLPPNPVPRKPSADPQSSPQPPGTKLSFSRLRRKHQKP